MRCRLLFAAAWRCERSCLGALTALVSRHSWACCVRTARRSREGCGRGGGGGGARPEVGWPRGRRRICGLARKVGVGGGVDEGGGATLPDGLPIQQMTVGDARGKCTGIRVLAVGRGRLWSAGGQKPQAADGAYTAPRRAAYAHMHIRTYQISRVACSSPVCLGGRCVRPPSWRRQCGAHCACGGGGGGGNGGLGRPSGRGGGGLGLLSTVGLLPSPAALTMWPRLPRRPQPRSTPLVSARPRASTDRHVRSGEGAISVVMPQCNGSLLPRAPRLPRSVSGDSKRQQRVVERRCVCVSSAR